MVRTERRGIARIFFAIVVAAVVILAGVVASSYLGAPRTGSSSTSTSTGTSVIAKTGQSSTSPTALQNPSCGIGPAYGDQWLTFKHDSQRTGYSSFNFSASAAGRFTGQQAWQNRSGFSEMAATQSELFVASYWLFALNLTNGKGLWTETTGAGPAPPIASDGKTVYLGANTGGLLAFNATTGANQPIGDVMSLGTVAICGDVAYVNSGPSGPIETNTPSDSLQALNLTSGKALWTINLSEGHFIGYPTTDGKTLYMIMDNGSVFAYTVDSGTLVWKHDLAGGAVISPPTSSLSTSIQTTTVTSHGGYLVETPTLGGGELYVTDTRGSLYALNTTNGDVVWATGFGSAVSDSRESSAVGYGMVFQGTYSEGLVALSASTGAIIWKAPLKSSDTSTPTVVDGSVFIADFSGTLYQFNASTGALQWSFTGLGQGYVSEPIVAGGFVVVDGNNGVFAFH